MQFYFTYSADLTFNSFSLFSFWKESPIYFKFADSDISADPEFDFGQLPNGMRHLDATKTKKLLVRLMSELIADENEMNNSPFVEHMAFNGSGRILKPNDTTFGAKAWVGMIQMPAQALSKQYTCSIYHVIPPICLKQR